MMRQVLHQEISVQFYLAPLQAKVITAEVRRGRSGLTLSGALVLLFLLIAALDLAISRHPPQMVLVRYSPLFVFALLIGSIVTWRPAILRAWMRRRGAGQPCQHSLTVDDRGLLATGPLLPSQLVPWSDIRWVDEVEGYFRFAVADGSACFLLPSTVLPASDVLRLREFLRHIFGARASLAA